jgi:MarR family transcriptional regulator, organic hydroperoxide resistance regulator
MAKAQSRKSATKPNEFLAGYLPYLLNRVTREMVRKAEKEFRKRGLTVSTWRVLAVLADRGVCGFGELARLTSIEPATLARFVETLIRDRLIRRRRSTADGRAVTITLTEKGEAAFVETLPWALDVENRLTRKIAPEDVKRLKAMLKTLYGNIHDGFIGTEEDNVAASADSRLLDL